MSARSRLIKTASTAAPSLNTAEKVTPSTKAAAVNLLGMMNSRASLIAIASISNASTAPNAPRRSGLAAKLIPIPSAASGKNSSALPRIRKPASRTENRPSVQARKISADLFAIQLGTHFLGNEMRVDGIANDSRADKDDQLGARFGAALLREEIANAGDLVQHRNA